MKNVSWGIDLPLKWLHLGGPLPSLCVKPFFLVLPLNDSVFNGEAASELVDFGTLRQKSPDTDTRWQA